MVHVPPRARRPELAAAAPTAEERYPSLEPRIEVARQALTARLYAAAQASAVAAYSSAALDAAIGVALYFKSAVSHGAVVVQALNPEP